MSQLASTGKGTWGSSARANPPPRGECYEVIGTGIIARPDIPYFMPGDMERTEAAVAWIKANCVGVTRSTLFGSFVFKEFDDAVAFKLRFNGEIIHIYTPAGEIDVKQFSDWVNRDQTV